MSFVLGEKTGLVCNRNLLILFFLMAFLTPLLIFFRDMIGQAIVILFLAALIGAYIYFAKLNFRQAVFLIVLPVFFLFALAKFAPLEFPQNHLFGVNLWLSESITIMLVLSFYFSSYLAELAFLRYPKLMPKDSYFLFSDLKKQSKYLTMMFNNELALFFIVFLPVVFLSKFSVFIFFLAIFVIFLRFFVLNNWEKFLMTVGFLGSFLFGLALGRLKIIDFRYVEFFDFPLWIMPVGGLFLVSVYRLLVSQVKANTNTGQESIVN